MRWVAPSEKDTANETLEKRLPFGRLRKMSRQGNAFESADPNGEMKLADLIDELRDAGAIASHLED